ncbi:MAG TPA: radical SAM protein [Pyrinomonadaceae bacterium]
MDILLVNPPTLSRGKGVQGIDPDLPSMPYYRLLTVESGRPEGFSTMPGEHLGLQSLQASLESSGHRVDVLNACVGLHATLRQTLNTAQRERYDVIGFTGPLDVFGENLWMARALRDAGYTGHITLGHDFATLNHELVLRLYPEFDSVVRGEGEETVKELARALQTGGDLAQVPGLSFRRGNGIVCNKPRPPLEDLDILPWVTRYDAHRVTGLGMSLGVFTKRGCPYLCTFCTTGAVPIGEGYAPRARWRQRSATSVVDEIEMLVQDFGAKSVTIVDDLYLSKGAAGCAHALEVAEELLRRDLRIQYMIDCRVDSIERDVFKVLKKSGLKKVFVGVESASEAALSNFRKGYRPDSIRERLRTLDELGVEYVLGYIFFSPFETLDGLEQNLRFVSDLGRGDYTLFLQSVRVYPGTPLQRQLAESGLLIGEFPFYKAAYLDPSVKQIRDLMLGFESLSLPHLEASSTRGASRASAARDFVYQLAKTLLLELLECGRRGDLSDMDKVFEQVVGRLGDALE